MTTHLPNSSLVIGFKGIALTEEEKQFISEKKPKGFIFFGRNIESKDQIKSLTDEIKNLYKDDASDPDPDIIICIDEEGSNGSGKGVSRLIRAGLVEPNFFPDASSYDEIYQSQGLEAALNVVRENYKNMGALLKSLGFTHTLAPAADLSHHDTHSFLKSRCFGSEIDTVVKFCIAAFEGLNDSGILGCLKHMPGHGPATADSHKDLPQVDIDLKTLEENDFKVFKEVIKYLKEHNIPALAMTAHVVYTALDPENPVTTSAKALQYIKDNIIQDGLIQIISDCLHMGAIDDTAAGAIKAFESGCNLLLCSHAEPELLYAINASCGEIKLAAESTGDEIVA